MDTSERVWLLYVQLKIDRLRHALKGSQPAGGSYIFEVFKEHIDYLLDNVTSSLSRYESDSREKNKINLVRTLDQLALYMRFYETGLSSGVHSSLRNHAQQLFSSIECNALPLLRPQNDQTYETRILSLHNQLKEFLPGFIFLDSLDTRNRDRIKKHIDNMLDVFIISYPKYLGDLVLLYPILGHEFGHVICQTHGLHEKKEALIESYSKGDKADQKRVKWKLCDKWATELLCDLLGWHFYGEAYIYALWLICLDRNSGCKSDSFAQYVKHSTYWDNLMAGTASGVVRPSDSSYLEDLKYPSPGVRLRELIKRQDEYSSDYSGPAFQKWRKGIYDRYREHKDSFSDPIFFSLSDQSVRIATQLYNDVSGSLHMGPAAEELSKRTAIVNDLSQLIAEWIPPCQIIQHNDGDPSYEPADWRAFLTASWIGYIEMTVMKDPPKDWFISWVEFIYQAFEMTHYYKTYYEARRGSPHADKR